MGDKELRDVIETVLRTATDKPVSVRVMANRIRREVTKNG